MGKFLQFVGKKIDALLVKKILVLAFTGKNLTFAANYYAYDNKKCGIFIKFTHTFFFSKDTPHTHQCQVHQVASRVSEARIQRF